jgi:hypothetical protein
LSTAAASIVNLIKNKPRPKFILAGYQRLRQDDFANRTDPSSVDLSIPRLKQLADLIKSDSSVGAFVDVVTVEYFSALMRKYLGLTKADEELSSPNDFFLSQNYPNPFNPATNIQYRVTSLSKVSIKVYDILGKEVAVLVDAQLSPGSFNITFDAKKYNLSSGIYFYHMTADQKNETRKMIYLR